MATKDLSGPRGQGGIDINRNGIEAPLADEFLDSHDQFLGAPDGESWDDDLALVGFCMSEKVQCLLSHALPVGFVQAIAVGRLKNQHVAWRWWLRIAKNGHVGTAKIPAEQHGGCIAACRVFYPNGRGSQDMAGIVKGSGHARRDLE